MKKLIDRYWELTKKHFYDVLRNKTTPHSIAMGFAIGTFISVLPTPFLNIPLGLLVVAFYDGINKFALFASIMFWNPLNLAPFYWLSFKIGDWLFGKSLMVSYELTFMDQVWVFTRRFLIGNVILAVVVSVISYYVIKWSVVWYRKKNPFEDGEVSPVSG